VCIGCDRRAISDYNFTSLSRSTELQRLAAVKYAECRAFVAGCLISGLIIMPRGWMRFKVEQVAAGLRSF
jgi:hypothetical protein